jgi:hypothetical protein
LSIWLDSSTNNWIPVVKTWISDEEI